MDDSIEKKLSEMPAARLVKIIQAALATMNEAEQIRFIAKYIDARTSLSRLGADDPEAFIDEVDSFCLDCLNGAYYSDEDDIETYFSENRYDASYYDDEWDYDEYYSNTEWACTFGRLFKLSMMYMQSEDFETGYEAAARLLSCLKELTSSDSYLGTDEPMSYISADWEDLFALHYNALFMRHQDLDSAIRIALRLFIDFGSYCEEGFLNHVKNTSIARRYSLEAIRNSHDWSLQRQCFELLTRLYDRLGEAFDMAAQANELIDCNVYFYSIVMEGLCKTKCWREAVETANAALAQIVPADDDAHTRGTRDQKEVRAAIQSKLADAYEQLSDFERACETVKQMFKESPSFALYKRARAFAEKTDSVSSLQVFTEEILKKDKHSFAFMSDNLLRDIYSYEGETAKMMAMAASQKIEKNYYDRKYIALSLIYRAVIHVTEIDGSLAEYISSAAERDGIFDMLSSGDDAPRAELLLHGADLLRGIIAFHIDAATRSRYAKAAYYMCVTRDIFIYLGKEEEFRQYFQEVISRNSRRPALRDEMGIVYGKAATMLKKH